MGRASPLLLCLWETRALEWMGTPWSSSIMLVARLTPIHRYTYISFLGICSHNRFNNCSFYRFLDKNFSNSFAFFRVEKSMEIFEINLIQISIATLLFGETNRDVIKKEITNLIHRLLPIY